jgi:hypothetical protein
LAYRRSSLKLEWADLDTGELLPLCLVRQLVSCHPSREPANQGQDPLEWWACGDKMGAHTIDYRDTLVSRAPSGID